MPTGLTNPAISAPLGGSATAASSGSVFVSYFIAMWRVFIAVAALTVLIYFLWGAFEWVTSGESSKVQKARDKMTNAAIGMLIMVGGFAIITFIGRLLGFDLLVLTLPTP